MNLIKATVSAAITPVAVVADVLTLPASAYNNKAPFAKTEALLSITNRCVQAALEPTGDKA